MHPSQPLDAIIDASMTLKTPAQPAVPTIVPPAADVIREGWVLKKRRKKMQGFARRYFVLHSVGLLSYAFEPNKPIRDQIDLRHAAISSVPRRRDIHIDSETATFHMKCLTGDDFERWMTAFRKFIVAEADRALGRRASLSKSVSNVAYKTKTNEILDSMGKTIEELSSVAGSMEHGRSRTYSHASTWTKKEKSRTPEREHKEGGSSMFSIFKKSPGSVSPSTSTFDGSRDDKTLSPPHEVTLNLIDVLREQHQALRTSLHQLQSARQYPSIPGSLLSIADEQSPAPPSLRHLKLGEHRSRASIATSTSEGSVVWFDADDGGPEEFVLEVDLADEEEREVERSMNIESASTTDRSGYFGSEKSDDATEILDNNHRIVQRRTQLPVKPTHGEGNLFSVLKKNVGQDLTNISFPVTFNEPLTLLQRSAEEMEYHELLDKAAAAEDWIERICYIAAFAVSGYASTKYRSGRKGFTPLLGETFEDVRMKFIAEKVVHKPLVIAYHAEGPGWQLNATSSGNTKFWGKSFEIIPTGMNQVRIGDDIFEWNKPSSFTRNLVMGTKYLEHCGEMVIRNQRTGASCVLDFKETGYWASAPNVVSSRVLSPDGETVSHLEGKWDEQMSQKLDSNHLRILWRVSPFPRDASDYYGYTYFGMTLNEITPDIEDKLPPTDSRFRPDVRALEEGDLDTAEEEKARVEDLQRQRRHRGQDATPRWFRQIGGTNEWEYAGGYWESRSQGWKKAGVNPLW